MPPSKGIKAMAVHPRGPSQANSELEQTNNAIKWAGTSKDRAEFRILSTTDEDVRFP